MTRKRKSIQLPEIEGTPKLGATYYTVETIDNGEIVSKNSVRKKFENRFGYSPSNIFFGPPNGSLIYAGPLTRDPHSAIETDNLQSDQPTLF